MVYYALAMSAGDLGENKYVSFSLLGLVEIPALVIGYFIVDRCVSYKAIKECSATLIIQTPLATMPTLGYQILSEIVWMTEVLTFFSCFNGSCSKAASLW